MSTMHLVVNMNGCPRTKGISSSSSMSMITKSTKKVKWRTLTRTSSTTPNGLVMEWSASWSVILVGSIFRSPILLHMESDIRLILAPKSIRVLPTDKFPIEHRMVTLPRSLNLGDNFWIIALQLPPTIMVSLLMYFPFFVRRLFRNFVYSGICCRASPKGIVISSFWKISRNCLK